LEADLRFLIAGLAFKGESVIASAFIDGSQLGENLYILRKLRRRYWDAEAACLTEIIDRTDKVRPKRNLFIHGLWSTGNFGRDGGFATVTDLRTTFEDDQSTKRWTHGQSEKFSVRDFQDILDEVNLIRGKIEAFCELIMKHDNDVDFGYLGETAAARPVTIALSLNEDPVESP